MPGSPRMLLMEHYRLLGKEEAPIRASLAQTWRPERGMTGRIYTVISPPGRRGLFLYFLVVVWHWLEPQGCVKW